jgi:hypothetical protein
MTTAVVIGNGTSRLNFDLNKIKDKFTTYGCNALYRDFIPHYLISMDIYMVYEILNNKIHHKTKFYTQHINQIDELATTEPIHFIEGYANTPDSGTAAIKIAILDGHKYIYLLGFDYHDGTYNNVYAGTDNYPKTNTVIHNNQDISWRQRLYDLIDKHMDVRFIRITDQINNSDKNNYSHMTLKQFKELEYGI